MGRHSPNYLAQQQAERRRHAIEMVEDVSLTAHLVTADAADDGLARGRYAALCGEDVLPAPLVAKQARYCRLCVSVPAQRATWPR